jgi:hypothetical protein
LVCRIRLDVVISILNRTELGHKSMGNTILLRSIFFVSSDVWGGQLTCSPSGELSWPPFSELM